MPNSYFQFKQFTVHQDRCAMKVCTDACLFGAWLGNVIRCNNFNFKHALDVGTGTGLLSLMLAQETDIQIEAIEINEDAVCQAKQNVASTPWVRQIKVIHSSLQEFQPIKKYDFIFSNPPFYEKDLISNDENKNAAKHDSSLTLEVLIDFIKNNLAQNGFAALLLPYHRTAYIESLLQVRSLSIIEKNQVRQSVSHDFFRTMILFSNTNEKSPEVKEISIHDKERNYTDEFVAQLKGYYLKFQ